MWALLWGWKMEDIIKRAFVYVPRAKIPVVVSGKPMDNYLVPYVMDGDQNWKQLSLLMQSHTSVWTLDLYIPDYDGFDITTLISFLRKRGMRFFKRLRTSVDVIRQVEQVLGPFYLESYQYDLFSMRAEDMRFQDFTTDIKMQRGVIHNIPNKLVNLNLKDVQISKLVMEAIGQSKSLRTLEINSHIIVIRGLPTFLVKLTLETGFGITFESRALPEGGRTPTLAGQRPAALDEGPGYEYECEYLTHFEYRKTGHRGSSIRFPGDLSFWMAESLTYLSITGDRMNGETSFPTIFSEFQKLQELHLGSLIIGNYPLPTSIKVLRIDETCGVSYSDAFGALPELLELYMPYELGFEPIAEHVLRTSPRLKTLTMDCNERTEGQLLLPTGMFPEIKMLKLFLANIGKTLVPLGPDNKILSVFPNVTTIQCYQNAHDWKADFSEKKLYVKAQTWLRAFPRTEEGNLSFEGTRFEKFHFHLEGRWLVSGKFMGFDIKLPPTTTEVILTFEDYRKGLNGDLYPANLGDIKSIQYNIREITKNKRLGRLQAIMIHARVESGRIYPSITLDNGTRIGQVFGEYDPMM